MPLTVPEAAERVGCNPETVRRWIRAGKLRAQKVGTQHIIDEQDLDAFSDPFIRDDLPREWTHADDGTAMPDWDRIARRQRDLGH